MAVYFLDTSAIVKRYVQETGAVWVRGLTDPAAGHRLYIATITAVEVVSAVARRTRGGSISSADSATMLSDFQHDRTHQYRTVEILNAVIVDGMRLAEAHALRGYDAVQLAAVMELNRRRVAALFTPATLLSGDQDLNAAAVAEGVSVDDPNQHP